jgi:predicted metal-dependent phosphoesterase TrpH
MRGACEEGIALIDLHSHTTESDGTCSPRELVQEAWRAGVRTLAITDHDTFRGFDQAVEPARAIGLDLICGIELSTKWEGESVHLLGYFFDPSRLGEFREWILDLQASRRDRNVRLAARLRELGLDISLAEVEARGRGMTGRPHFAQILLEKGYVATLQQAFDEYLAEDAKGYVDRQEPQLAEGVRRIVAAGGVASLAHPVRVKRDIAASVPALCALGLTALEAYHSDHTEEDTRVFLELAERFGLLVTGGSDFHGTVKPGIALGVGRGQVCVPEAVLDRLRHRDCH